MSVTFYRLGDDGYDPIGRVEDGEIVDGEEELAGLYDPEQESTDEGELIEQFDGPYVVAAIDEEGAEA